MMHNNRTVAVVGAGRWGKNLIKNFAEIRALGAVVDVDESKGKPLAEEHSVPFFTDFQRVLDSDISAVAIATHVFSHYELAKKALLAKKDVFVEKPMTTRAEEAEELIELAKENNCILMVGHLLLFQPGIQFIKKFLLTGQLGELLSISQIRRSLGTIRREENVLYSLGVHDLAVLDFLVGQPVSRIQVNTQEIITNGIADTMTIHLGYSSGLQAQVQLSWLWPVTDRQLMITGTKGALHFNELTQEVIFYKHFGNEDGSTTKEGFDIVFADSAAPLRLELEHFMECIQTRAEPLSDGRLGRDVVALMAQIMKEDEKRYGELLSA